MQIDKSFFLVFSATILSDIQYFFNPSMPPIRAVILDFDGVIANTIPLAMRVFRKFLWWHKHNVSEQDLFEAHFHTKSLTQILHHLREMYDIHMNLDDFIAHLSVIEHVALSEETLEVDPSLLILFAYCEEKNIFLALWSNSSRARIINILKLLQIEEYFTRNTSSLLSADDLTSHKPDPEVWVRTATNIGVPIESCLVIEDGLPGILWAKACGARSLYYHHFCTPDSECLRDCDLGVSDFLQVIDFIELHNNIIK